MKKLILILALGLSSSSYADVLEAGMTSMDITPPVGVPLAGYGGGDRRNLPWDLRDQYPFAHYFQPSQGKRDPIRVKSLFLRKGEKKLLFMSMDVVGVTADVKADLLKKIKYLGIKENELFLSATHTHSGPGTLSRNPLWQLLAMDRFERMIYDTVLSDLMWSAQIAVMNAKPADLYTTSFQTEGLQRNRRDANRGMDTEANLLLVKSKKGQWLGGIANYAIHGTSFGTGNLDYSADVPGEIERKLEEKISSMNSNSNQKVTFLFINGAEGDVSPFKGGAGRMKEIGRKFIEQGSEALQNPVLLEGDWKVSSTTVKLDNPNLNLAGCLNTPDTSETSRISRLNLPLGRAMSKKAKIWSIQIGNQVWMTWPGEPNTSLGRMLKTAAQEAGFQKAWVLGLTNDHLSYFTSESEYHEGGYESCASFYGPRGGESIVEGHRSLLSGKLR